MTDGLSAPPVLSTPDSHIINDISDVQIHSEALSNDELNVRYEIQRTITEIKQHKWRRLALQFPDDMLPHSARVYQLLARGLQPSGPSSDQRCNGRPIATDDQIFEQDSGVSNLSLSDHEASEVKLTILGDTSYGSCCVDEIAAEHVEADAVVHYGRACLSPTARLPVVHVFTERSLDYDQALRSFMAAFPETSSQVILTADIPYASHVEKLTQQLDERGYTSLFAATILHDPSSAIPNRTVPPSVTSDPSTLNSWHLFHISDPPTSLLLTMTASVASIHVFSTESGVQTTSSSSSLQKSTSTLLRRRYALVTSLSTVSVWGILINTLSVKNYLSMVDHVKRQIADAGKKSYLFVVGKINAAKVANFSEIGGWVVIGCWESSLIDSKEFYKPIITPFELQLTLQPDAGRVWTGKWRTDFDSVLNAANAETLNGQEGDQGQDDINSGSDDESEPPEFDLRTGRYVARTRPMGKLKNARKGALGGSSSFSSSTALTKRANGDVVSVNGVASPAADYLAQHRTWRGLEVKYDETDEDEEGGLLEEGRTGVASGYAVGESEKS